MEYKYIIDKFGCDFAAFASLRLFFAPLSLVKWNCARTNTCVCVDIEYTSFAVWIILCHFDYDGFIRATESIEFKDGYTFHDESTYDE